MRLIHSTNSVGCVGNEFDWRRRHSPTRPSQLPPVLLFHLIIIRIHCHYAMAVADEEHCYPLLVHLCYYFDIAQS